MEVRTRMVTEELVATVVRLAREAPTEDAAIDAVTDCLRYNIISGTSQKTGQVFHVSSDAGQMLVEDGHDRGAPKDK